MDHIKDVIVKKPEHTHFKEHNNIHAIIQYHVKIKIKKKTHHMNT